MLRALILVGAFGFHDTIRFDVDAYCSARGPEVLITLTNTSGKEIKVIEAFLPWQGLNQARFFAHDAGIEITNWVSFLTPDGSLIKVPAGAAIAGSIPLWSMITPQDSQGTHRVGWRIGESHFGTLEIDLSACPIRGEGARQGG